MQPTILALEREKEKDNRRGDKRSNSMRAAEGYTELEDVAAFFNSHQNKVDSFHSCIRKSKNNIELKACFQGSY